MLYPMLMIASTPLFLHRLGAENFGIWSLVNTIIAGLSVLNIGMADATIRYVSKYRGAQSHHGIAKVVNTTYSIYLGLALLVVAAGWGFSELTGYYNWFSIKPQHRELTLLSVKIASVTFGLRFVEQIFLAVFKGFERYDLSAQISIASKLIIMLLNIAWVVSGYGLIHIFTGSAVVTLFLVALESVLLRRFFKGFSLWPSVDKATLKEVSGYSLWSWVQSVMAISSRYADKFIVANFAGLAVMGYYNLAFMVMNQLHSLFAAGASWIFPAVSRKLERAENIKRFFYSMQMIIVGGGMAAIGAVLLLRNILFPLWLGPVTYRQTAGFIEAFLCYGLIVLTTIVPYYFINGSGKIKLGFWFTTSYLITQVIGLPVLYYFFGSAGMCWSPAIGSLLVLPVIYAYFFKMVLNHPAPFAGLGFLLPPLLLFAGCLSPQLWQTLLLLAASVAAFKIVYFNKADLKASLGFLKHKNPVVV